MHSQCVGSCHCWGHSQRLKLWMMLQAHGRGPQPQSMGHRWMRLPACVRFKYNAGRLQLIAGCTAQREDSGWWLVRRKGSWWAGTQSRPAPAGTASELSNWNRHLPCHSKPLPPAVLPYQSRPQIRHRSDPPLSACASASSHGGKTPRRSIRRPRSRLNRSRGTGREGGNGEMLAG